MEAAEKIVAGRENGVGTLVFNNPEKHNALSLEMWAGVSRVLKSFDADDAVRAIVLRGAGGKSFISGADISQFEERRSTESKAAEYSAITDGAWAALGGTPKPVIAAIEGYCIGGGLAVAMKADIRIATRSSVFGVPAARLGIAYPSGAIRDLVNLVGPSEAKWILFTGRQLEAAQALRIGLINEVVEDGNALDKAVDALTQTLAANAPLSMRASKETIDQIAGNRLDKQRLHELSVECIESADFAEGRKAFMEKRKPHFTGK
jgi:enoyl-CoA hydratase/carnithine racemase